MGLPRYLKSSLDSLLNQCTSHELIFAGLKFHQILCGKGLIKRQSDAIRDKSMSDEKKFAALTKFAWRQIYSKRLRVFDELTPVPAKLYVGLERESEDKEDRAVFRTVEVPHYFVTRLGIENSKRESSDRKAILLREQIAIYRSRVYSSRNFPSTLKTIIFERDNYTCQVCLRDRSILKKNGLHLECDHVLAWDDGGLTTYSNGQTICSACNKAKHHAKGYFDLLTRIRS